MIFMNVSNDDYQMIEEEPVLLDDELIISKYQEGLCKNNTRQISGIRYAQSDSLKVVTMSF